jgi:hypothetical protein
MAGCLVSSVHSPCTGALLGVRIPSIEKRDGQGECRRGPEGSAYAGFFVMPGPSGADDLYCVVLDNLPSHLLMF